MKAGRSELDPMAGPGFELRSVQWGGIDASFQHFDAGMDATPAFQGLPDYACQCPHWGYVISGAMRVKNTSGADEVVGAGELYYLPPGHIPIFDEATDLVEFSPVEQLAKTMEVVAKNMGG
jgi:hypothetical protein